MEQDQAEQGGTFLGGKEEAACRVKTPGPGG